MTEPSPPAHRATTEVEIVDRVGRGVPVAPSLVVEPDHAAAEIEADRIARRVSDSLANAELSGRHVGAITGRPDSRIRRRHDPPHGGTDPAGPDGGIVDPETTSRIRRATGHGRPLDGPVRRSMEGAFGTDLGHVRLHTGSEADRLNDRVGAEAFTLGNEVFVRGGAPDLSRDDGRELLAHEVAHTLQASDAASVGRIQRKGKGKGKGAKGQSRRNKGGKGPAKRSGTGTSSASGRTSAGSTPTVAAPDADSAFTRLAPIIDAAVPTRGDSAGFEASLKIAIDPSSFIQFDVAGDAERDERVTLSAEVSVGYGGSLPWGLSPSALAAAGMTFEATAGTTAQALTLFSYGYYRMFRESNLVPFELADRLWGRGGSTGASSYDEAEQWAAAVETSIFGQDDEAEVSRGVRGALEGEWSDGADDGASASLGAAYAWTTKYSKQTLESSGTGQGGQLGKVGKERATDGWLPWLTMGMLGRSPQLPVGESEHALSFESELGFGAFSGGFELEVGIATPLEFELELSAAGDLAASERKPLKMAQTIVGYIASLRRAVEWLRSTGTTLGQAGSVAAEAASVLHDAINAATDREAELVALLDSKIGGTGTRKTKLSVSFERDNGETTCTIELAYVSEAEHELDWGAVSGEINVSRERRIVSIEWSLS